jgi:hypothetical protein
MNDGRAISVEGGKEPPMSKTFATACPRNAVIQGPVLITYVSMDSDWTWTQGGQTATVRLRGVAPVTFYLPKNHSLEFTGGTGKVVVSGLELE